MAQISWVLYKLKVRDGLSYKGLAIKIKKTYRKWQWKEKHRGAVTSDLIRLHSRAKSRIQLSMCLLKYLLEEAIDILQCFQADPQYLSPSTGCLHLVFLQKKSPWTVLHSVATVVYNYKQLQLSLSSFIIFILPILHIYVVDCIGL